MGAFSIWHVAILGIIALVLFGGRGKVSDLMGDLGKGINSFRVALKEPEHESPATVTNGGATPRATKDAV